MALLSSQQASLLNNLTPSLKAQSIALGDILNTLYAELTGGALAITADPGDVDSLCLGGGCFAVDPDATDGLNLYWKASRFSNGMSLVTVPAGHVTLNPSATSYVEVDRSGTVTANNTGFTAGAMPLWLVVTGVSTINSTTGMKPILQLLGTRGVPGAMLSSAGATKEFVVRPGDLSATTTVLVPLGNFAGAVVGVRPVVTTSVAQDDANYWTVSCQNKGAAGTGTTDVLDTSAANTTKATGGSVLTANVARPMTLHGTPANLNTAARDVLAVTFTKIGTAANLTNVSLVVEVQFAG